ncbi:hypothetical protein FC88_GL002425 [Companilactobacillus futsaii JCM 17355]|nr:hypothetical protein FC88_GL002425 [Companilactobacillus futsaii JCM 17355]
MFTFFGGVLMKLFNVKFLFLLVFLLTLGLINQPITIQAAAPTKDEVFENAPAGLNLDGLIEDPNYENGTNDASLNKDFPVNIVEMLTKDGGQDQISSFWGKKYKDSDDTKLYNYFDLTKDQTISAWIYYGDVYHNYPTGSNIDKESVYTDGMKDDKTPDGLALVLQNDDRGAKAISTAIGGDKIGYPSYGETLGVWGGSTVDHSPLSSSIKSLNILTYPEDTVYNQKLQNGAIQNSFALELDALQNFKKPSTKMTGISYETIQGKDDYFDIADGYKGQHIMSGYPGDATTYNDYATKGFTSAAFTNAKGYYFSQSYNSGTSNNIQISGYYSGNSEDMNVNKAWKHLTFKYKKDGSFTYRFNDQELDGTAKPLNELSAGNGTIDTSKLGDGKYVRWGFTASTGSQYSAPNDVAIVMQQMPSTANVQSSVKLLDMSQYNSDDILGREISDLKNDSNYRDGMLSLFINKNSYNVANNDKLLFKYGLTYNSGTLETGEINTTLDLPENVNFTPGVSESVDDGSIGQLVYDDGTTQEILPSDITQNSDGSNSIKLELKTMDTSGQKATIYLYGQASATTTPKLVNGTPTTFNSQNYIENITTPTFIINDQLNLDATQLNQTIDSDKDATIKGTINYVNKSKFNGDDLTLHTKINGTQMDDTKYSTTSDTATTDFSMIMTNALSDGSPLKIGKNTIEVYVTDSLKRVSNTVTYTITVNDYKDLILTATSPDPMKVKITDPIQLDSEVTYSDGSKIAELGYLDYAYLKIDDNKFEKVHIDGGGSVGDVTTLFIKLTAGKLDVGEHTLYFYVNDGTRDSNIVEYHITVTNKTLLLKANDDDTTQIVQNNANVKLRGTYHYEDNSDFINKVTSVKYQITNEDGTKQAIVTKEIQTDDSTAEFTLTLKPIGADLFDNSSEQTLTDYLKTATGLKVGKNEVSVTAYDGDDATSNTETYTINVPTLDPTIESDSLTVDSIEQMKLPLSLKFTYSDANYQLQSKDLATFTQVKDNDDSTMTVLKKPETFTTTPYQFNIKSNWNNDLVEGQNTVSVYTMDRYLRKSNVLNYQMNILPSGTRIEVGNYRFKTIDPKKEIADYVQRDGAWNIEINSYQDKWVLKAKASNMLRQDITGNYSELSDLSLVNKKTENGIGTDLINNPIIATGDSTGSAFPISYTLFGNDSDANSGILLKTDGTPLEGEYQSMITWSIDDSI